MKKTDTTIVKSNTQQRDCFEEVDWNIFDRTEAIDAMWKLLMYPLPTVAKICERFTLEKWIKNNILNNRQFGF